MIESSKDNGFLKIFRYGNDVCEFSCMNGIIVPVKIPWLLCKVKSGFNVCFLVICCVLFVWLFWILILTRRQGKQQLLHARQSGGIPFIQCQSKRNKLTIATALIVPSRSDAFCRLYYF